jgi:type II secretory pathway pseudopilin PulG
MMNKIMPKREDGFTLIETLVYTAIFVMIVGSIASFASFLQTSRIRTQMFLEVNDQGTSLMRTITQSVRNGTSINAPTIGTSGGVLSISTAAPATNPTTFSATGEALYVVESTTPAVALTNNKVRVTNLLFSNVSRPATPGIVEIRFTLSNTASSTRPEEQYTQDFYGTAAIR